MIEVPIVAWIIILSILSVDMYLAIYFGLNAISKKIKNGEIKDETETGFYPSGGTYYVHCTKCLVATQPRKNYQFVINVWNDRYKEVEK